MSVLLDTHALLWWLTADRKLSKTAIATIENLSASRYISAISAFEITSKVRIGKLDFARRIAEDFDMILQEGGFIKLDLSTAHAFLAGRMPGIHRDPFDRMLAAQCKLENLSLITIDPAFREFGVDIIW